MILAVDSYHLGGVTRTAGVMFAALGDAKANEEQTHEGPTPAPYASGALYKRELPGILALLPRFTRRPALILVDGYVSLADGTPGLGWHLYDALGDKIPVIGVAKNPFDGADQAREVHRGTSERPLYVTAAGLPGAQAARTITLMHGEHRLPTLLKRVDALSRRPEPA
ncbi:MAG: endonuclease V [Pseudomonadota bacterium]